MSISESTGGYRFGVSATTPAAPANVPAAPDSAIEFVERVVNDPLQPVVMFALEWCEFCWSVRKMFRELGIEYRSIDLDSVEFQSGNRGGEIRAALQQRLGSPTIPQIFFGGEYLGGATETFDAFNDGSLQRLMEARGIEYDRAMRFDAYSFLPKMSEWFHL